MMTRRRPGSRLAWSLVAVLAAAGVAAPATPGGEVREEHIDEPRRHWSMGDYIPLVPSIHLPTSHGGDDLIQVWLALPTEGRIDARWLADQERYTLTYPEGTRSDRVEYLRRNETAPEHLADYAPLATRGPTNPAWTVMDVRGMALKQGGRYHVLRPVSGEPHAALRGWSWPRESASAQLRATRRLVAFAAEARRPVNRPPLDSDGLASLERLNECDSCHRANQPRLLLPEEERNIERATDSLGLFVPLEVLRDDCIVAHHRPEDINAEDPHVEVRCGDDPAQLRTHKGGEYYVCPDGRTPMGHRDVRAGLEAGHPYTEAVCASRRRLYERMTPGAQDAFADAARVCGIAVPAGAEGAPGP